MEGTKSQRKRDQKEKGAGSRSEWEERVAWQQRYKDMHTDGGDVSKSC